MSERPAIAWGTIMFDPAKFKMGARVQVADHLTLEEFFHTWK
jgi:hypothetical protein